MDQRETLPALENRYCNNPPLAVKLSTEGYIIQENVLPKPEKQKNSWLGAIIGYLILILFLGLFWWFFLLIGVILGIIGLLNTRLREIFWWETVCFAPGELVFSRYPLTLNDSDRLTFRCRLRDNFLTRLFKVKEIPTPARIEVKLLCVERVSYTKGTDTITETAIIESQTIHRQNLYPGSQEIMSNFDLKIPHYLPPSFEAKNNQIRWILLVEKYLPNLSDPIHSQFTLQVNYP
jgi:hypothetical protein